MILGVVLFLMAGIIVDPGVISVNVGSAPGIIYDRNDKSWTLPIYDQTKHIVKCIERDRARCLRGN